MKHTGEFGCPCSDCEGRRLDREIASIQAQEAPQWVSEPPESPGWYRVLLRQGNGWREDFIEIGEGYTFYADLWDPRPIDFITVPDPEKIGDCVQCSRVIMDNEISWQMTDGDDESWLCVDCARKNIDKANEARKAEIEAE